jgi:hypothetical protein
MNRSCTTLNVERRTLNAERQRSKVGRDRRARRGSQNNFYTKIAKSDWCFCYQRPCLAKASHGTAKQGLLGNWMRACTSRFVSLATFCKKGLESLGAPGGRALPKKSESKL